MIVSDANALRYLILVEAVHVLPALFGEVVVPAWVVDVELRASATPLPVREWLQRPPDWLVRRWPAIIDPSLDAGQLGRGEREAISLALESAGPKGSPTLLTDDRLARREALARGIPVFRTLALLVEAAARGVESPDAIHRLRRLPETYPGQRGFYAKPLHSEDALRRAEAAWNRWRNNSSPDAEP